MGFELKKLPHASLDAAIAKAEHYRDLNQPEEAESICLDVLDLEPQHAKAWKLLGLAITDRFPTGRVGLLEQAIQAFENLPDHYERTYHLGVAWERAAKAHVEKNESHSAVAASRIATTSSFVSPIAPLSSTRSTCGIRICPHTPRWPCRRWRAP